MPINFTLTYGHRTNDVDDHSGDVAAVAAVGTVRCIPQFSDNRPILGDSAGFTMREFTGWIDADGQLKAKAGGGPFRLWANDPSFNLQRLIYRVVFDLTDPIGRPFTVTGGYFEAPSTDTSVDLKQVLSATGVPSLGTMRTASYTEDILDAGAVGVELVKADTQAGARAAMDAAGGFSTAVDGQDTAINNGSLTARNPLYIDPTQAPYRVKPDRYTTSSASMSSSSNPAQLTVSGYTFTSADIGKVVKVVGAGSAGANLKTTISAVSAGKAVLASPCSTTVSNAFCIFGTDNAAALAALFNDLSATNSPRKLARVAVFPAGAMLYSGTLIFPNIGTVKGASENWANVDLIYTPTSSAGAENKGGTVFHQMWDQNVDCARVRDFGWTPHDWVGSLEGFMVLQDWENTAGNGISFRTSGGTAVSVINGGVIRNVAVAGAANAGWEFPNGVVGHCQISQIEAYECGYAGRKTFTCNTTNNSQTLTNVSDFTGLAQGDIVSGLGLPADSVIMSLNSGAGTITIGRNATATATGVTVERAGDPGIRYVVHGSESVHFDGISADHCSGGVLRLVGNSGTASSVIVTDIKNEFGTNVYRESRDVTTYPSNPQSANAIVLESMYNCAVHVRGLSHWAAGTSSVGSNAKGRDIGAAILTVPIGTPSQPADIAWEGLSVRLASGSGQTAGYAYRDGFTSTVQPVNAAVGTRGSNFAATRIVRQIFNADATITPWSPIVGWTTLSAPHTGTLPAVSSVAPMTEIMILDLSGSASTTNTITAVPAGSDTIIGDAIINTAYGRLVLISTGSQWVAFRPGAINPVLDLIRDTNGTLALDIAAVANAVNYLQVQAAVANGSPALFALGTDTNIGVTVAPKNAGAFSIYVASGQTPTILASGPDSSHDLNLRSKNGIVKINGVEAVRRTKQTVTTAATLAADGDRLVLIGPGGAPTLPTAVGNNFVYRFKNTDTASKIIAAPSGQTIDGAATLVLPAKAAVDVMSDDSNWVVM